jgi:hypothetical protein
MGMRKIHRPQTHPECDHPSVAEIDHFYTILPEIVDRFEHTLDAVNDKTVGVEEWEDVACSMQNCKRCGSHEDEVPDDNLSSVEEAIDL